MSKIKILPVYPRFPVTFWGHQGALEFLNKKSIMAPTGLATIAAMVSLDDFEVHKIADLNVRDLDDDQIRNSDAVGNAIKLNHYKQMTQQYLEKQNRSWAKS